MYIIKVIKCEIILMVVFYKIFMVKLPLHYIVFLIYEKEDECEKS